MNRTHYRLHVVNSTKEQECYNTTTTSTIQQLCKEDEGLLLCKGNSAENYTQRVMTVSSGAPTPPTQHSLSVKHIVDRDYC